MQYLIQGLGTIVVATQLRQFRAESASHATAKVATRTLRGTGEEFLTVGHIATEGEDRLRIDVGAERLTALIRRQEPLKQIAHERVRVIERGSRSTQGSISGKRTGQGQRAVHRGK